VDTHHHHFGGRSHGGTTVSPVQTGKRPCIFHLRLWSRGGIIGDDSPRGGIGVGGSLQVVQWELLVLGASLPPPPPPPLIPLGCESKLACFAALTTLLDNKNNNTMKRMRECPQNDLKATILTRTIQCTMCTYTISTAHINTAHTYTYLQIIP
jgi:hypothetical protein